MAAVKIPEDFLKALEADEYLHAYFMGLPPSHKREYVRWIEEAKRIDTRVRRIHEAIQRIRAKQHQVGTDQG